MIKIFVQFTAFAGVGAIGTAAQYAVLVAFVRGFSANPVVASTFGMILGAWINYYLNCRWTFRTRKRHTETLPKFVIVAFGGLALNAVIMDLLIRTGVDYLIAQICATAIVLFWNFGINRAWTFRHREPRGQRWRDIGSTND